MLRAVSAAADSREIGVQSESADGRKGRVLLTGGSGFLGSRTIDPLRAAGYEVHALTRRADGNAGVIWHPVDLLDYAATSTLVGEIAAERMLHLAWYTEHGLFWGSPENLDWVGASLRLLRAFHEAGGRRAVVAGSCAEYDWSDPGEHCRELLRGGVAPTPERPTSLYGVAKQATRSVASAYAKEVALSFAWGRVFLLYGPSEDERRLVPMVARALLHGQEAPTSDGTQIRDFMHVDDVARGFVALLDSSVEGPVNIASGDGVTIRRVLDLIAEAAGRPDLLRLGALPRRGDEPERLVADTRRLRTEVGFHPGVALEEGIADTVGWWRARLASD
jgi:nucleoside-diphosphate-sugar epimerase